MPQSCSQRMMDLLDSQHRLRSLSGFVFRKRCSQRYSRLKTRSLLAVQDEGDHRSGVVTESNFGMINLAKSLRFFQSYRLLQCIYSVGNPVEPQTICSRILKSRLFCLACSFPRQLCQIWINHCVWDSHTLGKEPPNNKLLSGFCGLGGDASEEARSSRFETFRNPRMKETIVRE